MIEQVKYLVLNILNISYSRSHLQFFLSMYPSKYVYTIKYKLVQTDWVGINFFLCQICLIVRIYYSSGFARDGRLGNFPPRSWSQIIRHFWRYV